MESVTQEKIPFVVRIQTVTMSDKERFSVYRGFHHGSMQDNTTFFCQVVESPDVVVTREKMNLNSLIREIGQFGKKAYVAFGYDMFVFEPKIKHITKQVKFQAIRFDALQKLHEHNFSLPIIFQ